jgi:glycosyltransferase involved in cell wall biosynthesis
MKLSILVCSVLNRRNSFLPLILEELNKQTHNKTDVEVICVVDNKTRMLGIKRNDLVNIAQGDYISFVDDDDKLSPDYVSELLKAIDECSGADVINFIVNVSLNGGEFKPCYYSVTHGHDFNRDESYHRFASRLLINRYFTERIARLVKS